MPQHLEQLRAGPFRTMWGVCGVGFVSRMFPQFGTGNAVVQISDCLIRASNEVPSLAMLR